MIVGYSAYAFNLDIGVVGGGVGGGGGGGCIVCIRTGSRTAACILMFVHVITIKKKESSSAHQYYCCTSSANGTAPTRSLCSSRLLKQIILETPRHISIAIIELNFFKRYEVHLVISITYQCKEIRDLEREQKINAW